MTGIKQRGPTNVLRVGLVGAGNLAQIAQLPVLAALDWVRIVGVTTKRSESADRNIRRWPIERAYPTLEEMLESGRLDCLFVLTPRREHRSAVALAIDAGVDVFCEKPLADTSDDALRLAEHAERSGRILMVDLNRRFAPAYRVAHDAFRLGAVQFCVAQKNRAGSEYRATLENAIHMVDLMRWFCGEATGVTAHADASDQWEEEGVAALIRFDSGAIGSLMAARCAGEWDERFDVFGGNTTARVAAPDSVSLIQDGRNVVTELRPRSFGWVNGTQALGFEGSVMHFLECVRNRETPLTNGYEAARTQALLEAILQSAALPVADDPDRAWISHSQR